MCRKHKSDKLFVAPYGRFDNGPAISVCTECESKVRLGGVIYCIPGFLVFTILLAFIIYANVKYK